MENQPNTPQQNAPKANPFLFALSKYNRTHNQFDVRGLLDALDDDQPEAMVAALDTLLFDYVINLGNNRTFDEGQQSMFYRLKNLRDALMQGLGMVQLNSYLVGTETDSAETLQDDIERYLPR